jgi:4-amino-4-deoxy-L-arabinose transferase-like glycosyltransferase
MDATQSARLTARHRRNVAFTIGAIAACALYLWLASRHLHSPGLQADEALSALPAVYLANGTMNGRYIITWQHQFGSWRIPVMNMEYMGALKTWVLAAAFKLFGVELVVMRAVTIALTCLGLLWFAVFARRCWGDWVAIASLWLLATDVNFVLMTRTDWGPVAFAFFFRVLTAWALARWWQSGGHVRWLWLASATMGLGLFDKVNFLWFIVALLPVLFALGRRLPRPPTRRETFIALSLGVAASLPLWIYNAATGLRTFRLAALPGQSVGLASLWAEFPSRFSVLQTLLEGRGLDGYWFGQTLSPAPFGTRSWLSVLSVISFTGLAILAVIQHSGHCRRRRWEWLMLPFVTGLMSLQIFATPRPVWLHHWIGIYPLPHLALALFFKAAGQSWRKSALSEWLGSLVIAGAVLVNLGLMQRYHQLLLQPGGVALWSNQINALTETLQRDAATRPLQVMDWGLSNQLNVLSAGRLFVNEPFWKCEQTPLLVDLLRDRRNVFVLHTETVQAFPQCRAAFFQAAQTVGVRLQMIQAIRERDGKDLYELWEVAP